MALVQFNPSVVVTAPSLPLVQQIGGALGNFKAGTATILSTGFPVNSSAFTVDLTGRYAYIADGSGNLLRFDLTSGGAPAQIVAASAITSAGGGHLNFLDISKDGTTIYGTTSGAKVVAINTATFAVTVLAGSGFSDPRGIALEPVNGLLLYVYDNGNGNVVEITIATGATRVVVSGYGGNSTQIQVGKSGLLYFLDVGGQHIYADYAATWAGAPNNPYANEPGVYLAGFCVDNDAPGESNLYTMHQNSNDVIRWNQQSVPLTRTDAVATTPANSQNNYASAVMLWRQNTIRLIDSAGNYVQVAS